MASAMYEGVPLESPKVLDRGGVLASLGYKSDKQWTPFKLPPDKDVCNRLIYPDVIIFKI